MRRLIALVVSLLMGPIGLVFAMGALGCSRMILWALWSGVFERPDFREDTGEVRIFRATEPDWFWGNVEFYSIIAMVFGLIAIAITWPLVIYVKSSFRTPDSR